MESFACIRVPRSHLNIVAFSRAPFQTDEAVFLAQWELVWQSWVKKEALLNWLFTEINGFPQYRFHLSLVRTCGGCMPLRIIQQGEGLSISTNSFCLTALADQWGPRPPLLSPAHKRHLFKLSLRLDCSPRNVLNAVGFVKDVEHAFRFKSPWDGIRACE